MEFLKNELLVFRYCKSSVSKALKKKKYKAIICEPDGNLIKKIKSFKPNVVFNALHGRFGEDGYVQTILENCKS